MSDDVVLPIPNMELAQHYFVLSTSSLSHLHDNARKELLAGVQADRMSLFITLHWHFLSLKVLHAPLVWCSTPT